MPQAIDEIKLQELLARVFETPPERSGSPSSSTEPAGTALPITRTSEDRSRVKQRVLEGLAKRRKHRMDSTAASPPSATSSETCADCSQVGLFDANGPGRNIDAESEPCAPAIRTHRTNQSVQNDVRELVATAYSSLILRLPEDHVVVNPIANAEFVLRCRELGATVSEFRLNRTLLNNRKAKRHSDVDRVPVASLERGMYDRIGHAVEIAASLVQREWYTLHQSIPSVDDILCRPELRTRFGNYASSLYEDADVVNCNLVLLAFRKSGNESAQRLADVERPPPLFTASHSSLDPCDVPESCGLYRVLCKRKPIFISGAANLRNRINSHLSVGSGKFLPDMLPFQVDGPVSFQVFTTPRDWRPRRVDAVARSMRIDAYPDLNWREKGALFADRSHVVSRLGATG